MKPVAIEEGVDNASLEVFLIDQFGIQMKI